MICNIENKSYKTNIIVLGRHLDEFLVVSLQALSDLTFEKRERLLMR